MKRRLRVLSYLYEATHKNRVAAIALVIIEISLSLIHIGFILAMRSALDSAALKNYRVFQRGLCWMAAFILLNISLRALFRHLDESVRSSVENNLKSRLLHHLLHADYAQTEAIHTGEWMNRMTSDTAVVAGGIAEILPNLCGMLVKLIGASVMITVMIPRIAYVLLPGGIFALVITYVLRKTMKKHHKTVQESDGLVRMFLQERLGSMMIVRAFRAEDAVESETSRRMYRHKLARIRRNLISIVCNIGFSGLMNGLYILGFAYCGFGLIEGRITYGTLLAVIQLIGQIQTPFAGLSGIVPRFYAMTASAERLMDAESLKIESAGNPLQEHDFSEIILENVSFSYPDGNQPTIFSGVSLSLCKGDYVALTGYSGCGKSTLFKLLLCLFQPTSGTLSIRTRGGPSVPLCVAHRALFSYVPQGNQLMSGTVREIISFAEKGSTDMDRMQRALLVSCSDGFVADLEDGIDTLLGEHGAGLSEGQMQRLAIARAIYADTPILLLDEATSALDEETERQVLNNLKSMTDKTVLIVTHRPAALEICNRVFEVTEGAVCEMP